jgi:hypothetical protein
MPEPQRDALEQAVADRVLEHLGLVVHLVPRVVELAHEPRLDQTVAADDGRRPQPAPSVSDTGRTVGATRALRGELLHHLGHRGRGEAQPAASCDGVIGSGCHSVWW